MPPRYNYFPFSRFENWRRLTPPIVVAGLFQVSDGLCDWIIKYKIKKLKQL